MASFHFLYCVRLHGPRACASNFKTRYRNKLIVLSPETRHRRVLSNTRYRSLESIVCRLNLLATTRIHVIKNVFRSLKIVKNLGPILIYSYEIQLDNELVADFY